MYFTFLLDIILLHAVFLSVFSVHPPLVADLCAQRLLCPTWLTLSHHWWISSYTCLRIGGLGFISSTLPWRQWLAELCCCFFLLCIGLICRILLVCQRASYSRIIPAETLSHAGCLSAPLSVFIPVLCCSSLSHTVNWCVIYRQWIWNNLCPCSMFLIGLSEFKGAEWHYICWYRSEVLNQLLMFSFFPSVITVLLQTPNVFFTFKNGFGPQRRIIVDKLL